MAAKVVIQDTVLTNGGGISIGASASIEVRDAATNGLVSLWQDRSGSTGESNPFTADANGQFTVYANPGRVKISVDAGGGNTRDWVDVFLLDMDADSAGAALNIDEIKEGAGADKTGFADGIRVDDIVEHTTNHGVEIEGISLKDGEATHVATAALLMPRGYMSGFLPSHAADTDHDMTLGVGQCRDKANTRNCIFASALTKQIDAAFAEGDAAGGMATGSVANDTTYHLNIIEKDASPGTFDWCYDTDPDGANTPGGWTFRRRAASILTDGSANIINGAWEEMAGGALNVDYNAVQLDLNDYSASAARQTLALSVPGGVQLDVRVSIRITDTASGARYAWVRPTSYTDAAANADNADVSCPPTDQSTAGKTVITDTSRQVAHRQSSTDADLTIMTLGFKDARAA